MKTSIALTLLLGLGCRLPSPSPPVVYYTLAPIPAAAARAASPGVEVLPVRLPELLQRPQMLVPEGASGLALVEDRRWGNPLDKDLQRVLARNLGLLLGSDAVAASPGGERIGANYRVQVEVQRWDARGGQGLVLEATWMITGMGGGPALAYQRTRLVETLAGTAPESLAAAYSAQAGKLSQEIVDGLRKVWAST